ncbi:hypothetical protein HPB47_019409 [Ixodes persulcatus]|uniref:Uncharacterized protein n=1 Tax=Ixodes persulcatus TaxID=34615 RepID=A0AC60QJ38_IXOPE|nr:hypothetical protein HPB47_019409 [Ixodes persulcatus]
MCSSSQSHQDVYYINAIATATCKARHYGYSARKGIPPSDVAGLFGLVAPSAGHAKRICKILRSESWRQARLFKDCLKAWCYRTSRDEYAAERKLRVCMKEATQVTEFLWERLRASYPKKQEVPRDVNGNVVFLGGASATPEVMKILNKGPKFATEPAVKPSEMLALVRQISDKTNEDNRDRCLQDCVERLRSMDRRPMPRIKMGTVVSFFKESNLRLLLSDKEGGFVVVPEGMFLERARQAVIKNFRCVPGVTLKRVKARALQLCGELGLDNLRKSVSAAKGLTPVGFRVTPFWSYCVFT